MGIGRAGFLVGCKVILLARALVSTTEADTRFPIERAAAAGYAFISADYRLVPPATAHDVLDDIKDVFTFISTKLNELLDQELAASKEFSLFLIDPDALAVAGTSAGGLCAYYAAMHISPKPKAVVCMYAMGGDFLVSVLSCPRTLQYLPSITI